jgi:hypothetical protein
VVSAVEDALSGYGVTINEYPLSPERIVELMEAGGSVKDQPGGSSATRSRAA